MDRRGVSISVAIMVIFTKMMIYYDMMGVTGSGFAFAAISTATFAWLMALMSGLRGNAGKWGFAGIYTAIGIVMLVDMVYYKQFNMYTSVNLFNMAGKLGDVTASVKQILDIRFLLINFDIAAILLLSFFSARHEKKSGSDGDGSWRRRMALVSVLTAVIFSSALMSGRVTFASVVAKSEFFNYHASDIYRNWIHDGLLSFTDDEITGGEFKRDKSDDEYFGAAKGNNLIVIQMESFQNFLINREYNGQEITPFLNSLVRDRSFYFSDYYNEVGYGNTSDAEFATNTSLFGTLRGATYDIYGSQEFFGLPGQLKAAGYETSSFHGYKGDFWNRNVAHPNQGFDEFVSMEDFGTGEMIGMGLSDKELFRQGIDRLEKLDKPFYGFFITLSQHHPYELDEGLREIELKSEDEGTLLGNYIESARYTDRAIESFFRELKERGMYDDTVIAIYGDHQGLVINDKEAKAGMERLLGRKYEIDEMARVPLIIHSPSFKKSVEVDEAGGQVDFMPTVMNLLGVRNRNPFIMGRDMLNTSDGFVPMMMYTGRGSYITDDVVFLIRTDNVFEKARAWNRKTGEAIDVKSCSEDYKRALEMFDKSDFIKLEDKASSDYIKGMDKMNE